MKPNEAWKWVYGTLEDWRGYRILGKRNGSDNKILELSYAFNDELYYDLLKLLDKNIRVWIIPNKASVDIQIDFDDMDWDKIFSFGGESV